MKSSDFLQNMFLKNIGVFLHFQPFLTEPSPVNHQKGGFTFVQKWGFMFVQGEALHSNSTKIPLIYSVSYFNLGGLGAVFGGLSPPKPPWRRDCFLARKQLIT